MNPTKHQESGEKRPSRAAYQKEYREKNKAELKVKSEERYQKNKESLMDYRREWRRGKSGDVHHEAVVLGHRRKFREIHASEILADDRKYNEQFPECRSAARHGSRARNFGNSTEDQIIAATEWIKNAKSASTGTCAYCRELMPMAGLGIDHIIPYSKGGLHEPGNLTLCCNPCNSSKGNRIGEQQGNTTQV